MSFRDSRQMKIPSGVKISIEAFDRNGSQLRVSGPKGSLTLQIPEGLQIVEEPEQNLMKDVPKLVRKFKKDNKISFRKNAQGKWKIIKG